MFLSLAVQPDCTMTLSDSYRAPFAVLVFIASLTLTALACTRSDVPAPEIIGLAAEAAAPDAEGVAPEPDVIDLAAPPDPVEVAPGPADTAEPVAAGFEPTAAPTEVPAPEPLVSPTYPPTPTFAAEQST